jgi:hypothetical protein
MDEAVAASFPPRPGVGRNVQTFSHCIFDQQGVFAGWGCFFCPNYIGKSELAVRTHISRAGNHQRFNPVFEPRPTAKRQRTGTGPLSGDEGGAGHDSDGCSDAPCSVGPDSNSGVPPLAPSWQGQPGFNYEGEVILLPDTSAISNIMGSHNTMHLYSWAQSCGLSDAHFSDLLTMLVGFKCPDIFTGCSQTLHNKFDKAFPNARPMQHDFSIPSIDLDQHVKMYYVDPYLAIVDMLQDSDNDAHQGLHLGPIDVRNKVGAPVFGEAVCGEWYRGLPIHYDHLGERHLNIIVNLSSDGTPLNSGKIGTHPLYVQLGNLGNIVKQSPISLRYVGSIPQLQKEAGRYAHQDEFKRRERILLQQCHAFIIKSIMDSNRAQPRVQFRDGQTVSITIIVNSEICDHMEAAVLASTSHLDCVK